MGQVGIIGNFNMDIVIGGLAKEPKWDSEVMAQGYEKRVAGTAGYMAYALHALGIHPMILSSIGEDQDGTFLLEQLYSQGINTEGIIALKDHQTPTSFVIVHKDGSRAIVTVSGAHDEFGLDIYNKKKSLLMNCKDIIICGNYLLPKFTVSEALQVATEQKALGKKIYFDPSWDPNGWSQKTRKNTFELLKYIDVCLLNETEICHLTDKQDWQAAAKVVGQYCNEVVVKLGSKGAAVFVEGVFYTAQGYKVPVYDSTGAGDTFDMGYLFASRKGMPYKDRLDFGNKIASVIVSQQTRKTYPRLLV